MEREYEKDNKGHVWMLNEDGNVDIFGYDVGDHNGPVCEKCGYGFCHHCSDVPKENCTEEKK